MDEIYSKVWVNGTAQDIAKALADLIEIHPVIKSFSIRSEGGQGSVYQIEVNSRYREIVLYSRSS